MQRRLAASCAENLQPLRTKRAAKPTSTNIRHNPFYPHFAKLANINITTKTANVHQIFPAKPYCKSSFLRVERRRAPAGVKGTALVPLAQNLSNLSKSPHKKSILRLSRSRQMLGSPITARLCACRYGADDAGGGLLTD